MPFDSSPGRRLRKKMISVTTSVWAFVLKAVSGRRIAPIKSACSAIIFRDTESSVSMLKRLVTNATTPPGATISKLFRKKKL